MICAGCRWVKSRFYVKNTRTHAHTHTYTLDTAFMKERRVFLAVAACCVHRSTGAAPPVLTACSSTLRRLARPREPPTNLRGLQLGAAEAAPAA